VRTSIAVIVFLLVWQAGWGGIAAAGPGLKTQNPESKIAAPQSTGRAASAKQLAVRVLATDRMAIRVPDGRIDCVPPRTGKDIPGPILSIRGPDGVWRGSGWVAGAAPVAAIDGTQEGAEYVVTYAFTGGGRAEMRFRMPDKGDHLRVTEECSGCTNTWVLSFSENFGADRVLAKPTEADDWSGIRRMRRSGQFRHGRLVFWSQLGQILDFNDWMGVFGGRAERDFVGFMRIHSDKWTRPSDNYMSLWERDGALQLEGNWRTGRREWLLVATQRTGNEAADARDRLHSLERQWVWNRDGWVLEWDEPLTQYRPDLTESEQRDKEVVLAELGRLAALLDQKGYLAPPDTRPFVPVCQVYGQLRQLGVLRPDEDRRARRALALLAYNCYGKDVFPWDRAMLPPGHPDGLEPLFRGLCSANFNVERCAIVGDVGLMLPRHPMSRLWIEHFADQFQTIMKSYVYPGGFWEEGFSGAYETLLFLTPTAMRARLVAGGNLMAEAHFRSMWDCLVQTATPREAKVRGERQEARGESPQSAIRNPQSAIGWRSIPPIGDMPNPRNWRALFLLGASAFQGDDPLLARRLFWLHQEMGGAGRENPGRLLNALAADGWAKGGQGVTIDLPSDLTSAPQTLASVNLPGLGAVLRGREPTGDETCLVFRNGLAWGRSHNDDGSVQLWAKGVALVTDAAQGTSGSWQRLACGHSRLAFPDFEPAYMLDGTQHGYRQSHRGQMRFFVTLPGADYICGVVPVVGKMARNPSAPYSRQPTVTYFDKPIVQHRHILFLKPDYFVLLDEMEGKTAHDFWLHVNADRVTTQTKWTVFRKSPPPFASFAHSEGVILDTFFLEPRGAQVRTGEIRTTEARTLYAMVASEDANGYRAVLYPRRPDERRPDVREIAPGIAKIVHSNGWDVIVLGKSLRTYRDRLAGVAIEAAIAVVRRKGPTWTAVLVSGKTISLPGLTISPSVPLSLTRNRYGTLSVEVLDHQKPAGVRLEGRWLSGRRLRVEGQSPVRIANRSLELNLPVGINRFMIE